jgi:hypothetical protein
MNNPVENSNQNNNIDHTKSNNITPPEIGGQKGPEPTRYGDWEKNGRVSDF